HEISQAAYDLILLDLMMPKMSGVDFLDSLRAMTSDPSVKAVEKPPAVIVITSATDSAVPTEVIEQRYPGVIRGVFRKPLDAERLSAYLDELTRSPAPGTRHH